MVIMQCKRVKSSDEIETPGELFETPLPSSREAFNITQDEILRATNSFGRALMIDSGFGRRVYKGKLCDGAEVAVERLCCRRHHGSTNLFTRLRMLAEIRHPNLFSLFGHTEHNNDWRFGTVLVYDYMARGTLRDHLYVSDGDSWTSSVYKMSWEQRLQICIISAEALNYLHTRYGVIHGNVRSTSIFLDDNCVAKVGDYSLLEHDLPMKDEFHNSFVDPYKVSDEPLTKESDVYSFGVLLLEVLCARPALLISTDQSERSLAEWGMLWQKKGELERIIDPALVGSISSSSLKLFGETAKSCLRRKWRERPVMRDVLWNLELSLELQLTGEECPVRLHEGSITDSCSEAESQDGKTMPSPRILQQEVENDDRSSESFDGQTLGSDDVDSLLSVDSDKGPVREHQNSNSICSPSNWISLRIPFAEIKRATEPFNPEFLIGKGSWDNVCRGTLDNGLKVVVQRKQDARFKDFEELMDLCQIRHPHIVSLVGYYDRKSELIVVSEHVEKGTLWDNLLERSSSTSRLSWEQRLRIVVDLAEALHFLHIHWKKRAIDGGFTSSSILLDENNNAKVDYFHLGRSRDYIRSTPDRTENPDVFSLGKVIEEMLLAQPAFIVETDQKKKTVERINHSSLTIVGDIAHKCMRKNSDEQPIICDVLWNLQLALEHQLAS